MATARSAPLWQRSGFKVGLKRIKISPPASGSWRRFQSNDAGKIEDGLEKQTTKEPPQDLNVEMPPPPSQPMSGGSLAGASANRDVKWTLDLKRERLNPEFLEAMIDQGLDIEKQAEKRKIKLPQKAPKHDPETEATISALRTPRNVTAIHDAPLRRTPTHNMPVCDLQLRSYDLQQLDLMSDFAMRAAYYLGLPALGPIPLPRITERWTVPRAHFVHKKSQENFERITLRRLLRIVDGEQRAVRLWLGACMKWQAHGVGMKASVWRQEPLGVGARMDAAAKESEAAAAELFDGLAVRKDVATPKGMDRAMSEEPWKRTVAGNVTPQLSGDVPRAF